jgi:hypothetical protein
MADWTSLGLAYVLGRTELTVLPSCMRWSHCAGLRDIAGFGAEFAAFPGSWGQVLPVLGPRVSVLLVRSCLTCWAHDRGGGFHAPSC